MNHVVHEPEFNGDISVLEVRKAIFKAKREKNMRCRWDTF